MAMLPVSLHHNSVRELRQQEMDGALQRLQRVQGRGYETWEIVGFMGSAATAFLELLLAARQRAISVRVDLCDVPGDCRAFGMVRAVIASPGGESTIPTQHGNGATRFTPIFNAASENGVQCLVVEQDQARRDPMESECMNAACMRIHLF